MTEIKFMNGSSIKCIETSEEVKCGADIFQNIAFYNSKVLEELDRLATEIYVVSGYTLKEPSYELLSNVSKKWQMRSCIEDEEEAHEKMLERLSTDTGVNVYEGREDNE